MFNILPSLLGIFGMFKAEQLAVQFSIEIKIAHTLALWQR